MISVIICTHNPKQKYLSQVLDALDQQTLSSHLWELLLVDNASDKILALEIDMTWHPNARHIREEQLGLTSARVRGIKESNAEILVFVDDDNILSSDYLENTLKISHDYPFIGAWGGIIDPLFEGEPPDWIYPYLDLLAVRQFEHDVWSNLPFPYYTAPCGAGLCIRRVVMEKYLSYLRDDPIRLSLDRKGSNLSSCGDSDLALTACDIGLGTGRFTSLKMKHIIPEFRCQEEYIIRLAEGLAFSGILLAKVRDLPVPRISFKDWFRDYAKEFLMNGLEKKVSRAKRRGQAKGIEFISTL